ncbi:MAG TPA: hypothetical protein VHC23_04715 [Jatrophihabitans sp.]|nr:hypothetical protein [Jatrophihabitans sp.]
MSDADVDRDAPPVVVGAVAAGSVPVPFLGVYAVMFIVHGKIHPVVPPDITDSQNGEFVAGLIALALFVVSFVAVIMMLNGTRRWPFVLVQLADLAGAIDLVSDRTRGGGFTAVVLGVAALVAIVLAFLPQSHRYVRDRRPGRAGRPVADREPAAS